MVDDSEAERVSEHKWYWHKTPHAKTKHVRMCNRSVTLHHFVLGVPESQIVDHRNGNGLDNQRGNLRACTRNQSVWNRGTMKTNKTGYPGIVALPNGNFAVHIRYKGKRIHLGTYPLFITALVMRMTAEVNYFREFAPCLSRKQDLEKIFGAPMRS